MRVKKVDYVSAYKLKILFGNGNTKIVDIEPIIKKGKRIFQPLKDIDYFKKVSLDDEVHPLSICWPNGADICPDVLYEIGKEITRKKATVPKPMARKLKRPVARKTVVKPVITP